MKILKAILKTIFLIGVKGTRASAFPAEFHDAPQKADWRWFEPLTPEFKAKVLKNRKRLAKRLKRRK